MSKKSVIRQAGALPGFADQLPRAADTGASTRKSASGRSSDVYRESAFKEAFADGYQAGFQQGLAEAAEKERARLEVFRQDLRSMVIRIEDAMGLWFQKAEFGLCKLATEMAQRVVCEELSINPSAISPIVKEALAKVENSHKARIRVNPFHLQALNDRREEISAVCGSVSEMDIVADDAISLGSVVIESESGVIDATVESKLALFSEEDAA